MSTSSLGDFTAPDKLRELVDTITDYGRIKSRFENMALQNISKWMSEGGFPKGQMRIFGYPAINPYYILFIEESEYQFPHLHVRSPSEGHNRDLLKESLASITTKLKPELEKHGQLLLESDDIVRDMFLELRSEGAPFETIPMEGECLPFFMDGEQTRKIVEMKFEAPEGFFISFIDVAGEYEQIHSVWPFRSMSPPEIVRMRLEHLPSVCIRTVDGDLASWAMCNSISQVSHLFTLHPYRGKGLGTLVENLCAQKFARQGMQVFKDVRRDNYPVVRGTMANPLWSPWKSIKNGKESDEDQKEDILWTFNMFTYIASKEN